jgi:glycosyltransferase involved in cell wall biosynthesis
MKVAVYTIALNEEQFIARWLESAKEADYLLLADTGSTDHTADLARSLGINVYQIKISPWRFDDAKNSALNLLPSDIDVAVSLDMDEVLLPGWRNELEKSWTSNATILNHRYRHNGGEWQWHSKIHARHGCKWIGAVHEELSWAEESLEIWNADIYLDEWQDTQKSRRGYKDLLHKKINEGDTGWRTKYFLANEYESIGDLDSAASWRGLSYANCEDGPVVKAYIAKNVAKNYISIGDVESAKTWLGMSYKQSPERETLYEIAKLYSSLGDHKTAYKAAQECLDTVWRRDGFTFDPEAWGSGPYDLLALSQYYIGHYRKAYDNGKIALKMDPNNERLIKNLEWYKGKLKNGK